MTARVITAGTRISLPIRPAFWLTVGLEVNVLPTECDAVSQDGPQLHPCEALVEPRIRAQAVPLRRHGEMYQYRVACVDQALKLLDGRVEVASLREAPREEDSLIAKIGLCAI